MKNLKIKLGLFSLLAILAVSVFLTSCEQEDITTQTTEEFNVEEGMMYILPKECNTMSEDELNEYLDSLTPTELSNLSSTNNDLEDRGVCRSWSTLYSYCRYNYSYNSYCWRYKRKPYRIKKQGRWCYPPTNHAYYDIRYVVHGCC